MGARDTIPDLVSRIDGLIAILEAQDNKSHITVTHTQQGNANAYIGAALACCAATTVLMLAFIIIENRSYTHLDNQIDQLRAWNDINRAKIAGLESKKGN